MIDAIRDLADADLRALASALRAGRLCPPYTATTLQRYCRPERAAVVADSFQRLADEGMKAEHLAQLLETAAALRSERAAAEDAVELVWTGPDLPGPCCRDTAVVVRELFGSARDEVLIVGYAVHQGKDVFRVLAHRMDESPALRVRMFLDVQRPHLDASPSSEVVARFAYRFRMHEWPGRRLPEVFYDPRSLEAEAAKRASLHAKCVVVDRQTAFVSSANFTEAAQVRNVEVGTLVHSERFAGQLAEHLDGLVRSGTVSLLSL
jgi:phosphatidylserine/phosphatidylglycerophosphate/cardiolipin synthase-like enzyme